MSFTVPGGACWMLYGPNGSGKSTMLRCIATAIRPHHGAIRVGGQDLWEDRGALRADIALLGHQIHLWDDLSPRDNLVAWARLGGQRADPDALLRRVGLDPTRRDPVRALSAGMKRRLALARVLLKQPRIALLDEPFGALDPAGRELVLEVIRELGAAGSTVVLASHLPRVAGLVCTRAVVLNEGSLVAERDPAELVADTP